MEPINFNRPYLTGKEAHYLYQAVLSQKLSGNGAFTQRCHRYFTERYGFKKCLLTTSCTDALEMAAILADIQPGDEVIMPAYTFVSTSNAFVLRGAQIVFCDSRPDHPNMDETQIEQLITPRTKAIVVVHYAGVACEMDTVLDIANRHNILVIEDAAQAIDSFYQAPGADPAAGRPLGGIGHLSAFSFHETKNIQSGEGGMLVVNDDRFANRAEIIWEKGTNRSAFFRGEVDKYNWVDIGSSYLPSEITAAFLYAQIENLNDIQRRRLNIWQKYWDGLSDLAAAGHFEFPLIPAFATNNAHMFYLVTPDADTRNRLTAHLKSQGIYAAFHYQSLHRSPFYEARHKGGELPYCDHFSDCLTRLPFFYEITDEQQNFIICQIRDFFRLTLRR